MATRVNIKALIILVCVLTVVMGGAAAIYWYTQRASFDQLVSEGNILMANDQPNQAVARYGMALNRDRTNLDVVVKYLDALRAARPEDQPAARRFFEQLYEWSRRVTELYPDNELLLKRHYQLLSELAQRVDPVYYRELYTQTDNKLDRDPNNRLAMRYRGIAQGNRLTPDMDETVFDKTLRDLETALEDDPQDAEALFNLAGWNLTQARRLQNAGARSDRYQPFIATASEVSQIMYEQDPNDTQRQLYRLQILMDPMIQDRPQAQRLALQMHEELMRDPSNDMAVMLLSDMLPRLIMDPVENAQTPRAVTEGILLSEALLNRSIEEYPNRLLPYLLLADNLRRQGRIAEAIDDLDAATAVLGNVTTIEAIRQTLIEIQMLSMRGRLLYETARKLSEGPEQRALISRIRDVIRQLELKTPQGSDAPIVNELQGKVLAMQGRLDAALAHIDRASTQARENNPELLLLSANIRRSLGEVGAARDRMQQLIQMFPDYTPARLQLARDYLAGGDVLRAEGELQQVLREEADNTDAQILQAHIFAAQGDLTQAIALLRTAGGAQNPAIIQQLVRMLMQAGEREQARQILADRFSEVPDELNTLLMLLQLTESREQRQAYISQARDAGGDAEQLDRITRLLASDEPFDLDAEIARIEDPIARSLSQAELAANRGNLDEAKKYLDEAARINADDERVMMQRFRLAVVTQDWLTAERLVERATTLNMDHASGAFWRARLAAAQNRMEQAVTEYRRGLSEYPVYSEGHRELGQLYMQMNNFPAAADSFQTAIQQRPNDIQALRGLAAAHDRLGNNDRALETIRRAHRFDPANSELLNLYIAYEQQHGNPDTAVVLREQLIRSQPDNQANRRALAVMLAEMQRGDEAMAQVNALIDEFGGTRDNVGTKAHVLSRLGQPEQGLQIIETYMQEQADELAYTDYLLKARYLQSVGRGSEAVEAYFKGIALEPEEAKPVSRELADIAFSAGQFQQARSLYQQIHATSPQDESVKLRLVETQIRLGELQEAQAVLNKLAQETAVSVMLKSLIQEQSGNDAQAMRILNEGIAKYPQEARLYYTRARLYAKDSANFTLALQDLERAMSRDPGLIEARQLLVLLHIERGEIDQAIRELRQLLARRPDSVEIRVQLFNLYLSRNDVSAARALIEQAERQDPANSLWPRLQARLAAMTGNQNQLISAWQRAVDLQPTEDHVASYVNALLMAERASQALSVLSEHAQMVNQQPVLQALRGRAIAMQGNQEQAEAVLINAASKAENIQQFETIVEQAQLVLGLSRTIELVETELPGIRSAWKNLILAQLELRNRDMQAAVDRLTAAENSLRNDSSLWVPSQRVLAISLHELGRYGEAKAAYQRVIESNPREVASLNNLAYLLARNMGDFEDALPLARRASQIAPDNAEVLDTLGYIQLELGQLEEARESLDRSVAIRPFGANLLRLAQVEHGLGNTSRARDMLRRSIEILQNSDDQEMLAKAQGFAEQW